MDPQTVFCPNPDCPARGQVDRGNIVHSTKEHRYLCHVCRKTFAQTKGTVFYRLRTAQDVVTLVVTLLAYGCPLQAIVAAFGLDERTVAEWQARAGAHCEQVHQHLVQQPRDLGQVQADEIRVKLQNAVVWLAMAVQVSTGLRPQPKPITRPSSVPGSAFAGLDVRSRYARFEKDRRAGCAGQPALASGASGPPPVAGRLASPRSD